VMRAMRAIMDFIFCSQSLLLSEEALTFLDNYLQEFHIHKVSIVESHGRLHANGPVDHFHIPKLEMLGIITRSTRLVGAPYQYTSDVTERCHIHYVKLPY
ncbi:hypothetical protein BDN70DRAFT_763084, partial [Pholiota conissans]